MAGIQDIGGLSGASGIGDAAPVEDASPAATALSVTGPDDSAGDGSSPVSAAQLSLNSDALRSSRMTPFPSTRRNRPTEYNFNVR